MDAQQIEELLVASAALAASVVLALDERVRPEPFKALGRRLGRARLPFAITMMACAIVLAFRSARVI